MSEDKRIIEVNGVKLEVDLRTARVVDEFRVGSPIKVLVKDYNSFKSHAGVIVGFDEFKNLPTIIIAYVDDGYRSEGVNFVYYNKDTEDVEICPANPNDIPFSKENTIDFMDNKIAVAEASVVELRRKKEIFLKQFGAYFKVEDQLAKDTADALTDLED